jgi:predicted ATP-dependent endonuclease of OLD family
MVLSCFLIYFVKTVDNSMKVKELYIKKYHQFEDFKLDLTYPEGHEKAGQPLDKVCFIGQSGTGKTSLLDFIQKFISDCLMSVLQGGFTETELQKQYSLIEFENLDLKVNGGYKDIGIDVFASKYDLHKRNPKLSFIESFLQSTNLHTLRFHVNFSNVGLNSDRALPTKHTEPFKFLEINGTNYDIIWNRINDQIISYRENQIQQSLSISDITKKTGVKAEEILEAAKKYQEWEQNNPNPLQDLADRVLDKILNKFNLRVRTRLDFEKIEDVKTIKIENLEGQEVPYDFQSTGTRQIFLSMLPLYTLKPNRTAIFFDEPERSLYPDIQKEIVDIYTSLTTDCQFFYATHSPIIASSFEPWEIVELKFKDGKVFQELYYEGERHVDNYTINPQYLRWDDILQRVFDLDSEGNEKRVKALMKLATLESKLKKQNLSPEERETLWNEYLKLSKLTGWTTRITDEKN